VTYADDLVILCSRGKAEQALQKLREILGKLKLKVNEEKTRISKVPQETFDFLDTRLVGCTRQRQASPTLGCARPRGASNAWSRKSMR
jgi:hypothetical protein